MKDFILIKWNILITREWFCFFCISVGRNNSTLKKIIFNIFACLTVRLKINYLRSWRASCTKHIQWSNIDDCLE